MQCEICGSEEFIAGYQGRLTNGAPPTCAKCGSAERHRVVFHLLSKVTPTLKNFRVLHFAPDQSVNQAWFKSYFGSVYGGKNSLNMMATGLEDSSFDLILSNHVLEHVPDDMAAIKEMLRLVGPNGMIMMTVPNPMRRWVTLDWNFPDESKFFHFRDYGADFGNNVVNTFPTLYGLISFGADPITGLSDHVNIFSYNKDLLAQLALVWQRSNIPLISLHRP